MPGAPLAGRTARQRGCGRVVGGMGAAGGAPWEGSARAGSSPSHPVGGDRGGQFLGKKRGPQDRSPIIWAAHRGAPGAAGEAVSSLAGGPAAGSTGSGPLGEANEWPTGGRRDVVGPRRRARPRLLQLPRRRAALWQGKRVQAAAGKPRAGRRVASHMSCALPVPCLDVTSAWLPGRQRAAAGEGAPDGP